MDYKNPCINGGRDKHKRLGRGSRTLSKLFESIVNSPDEYGLALDKAKEILSTPQRKFIEGIRY